MASTTSVINVNVDAATKQEAAEILKKLGMNMSTAINVFLRQVVKHDGIPFEIVNEQPNRRLKRAMKESNEIMRGDKKVRWYDDVDEMMEDILDGKKC